MNLVKFRFREVDKTEWIEKEEEVKLSRIISLHGIQEKPEELVRVFLITLNKMLCNTCNPATIQTTISPSNSLYDLKIHLS